MNWKKLQNGSDIRGIALDGVEGESVNLTPEAATILGKSFAIWLRATTNKSSISVSVGTDSRISGKKLKKAFIDGLQTEGVQVFDCELASTPAMFMTTVIGDLIATGAVMITASHLPFNRNGFKFFTANGGLDKKDISRILEIAENTAYSENANLSEIQKRAFIDEYSLFLVNYIRNAANIPGQYEKPLKGLKIIVDAGNGSGGFFASKVLQPLGADTTGSQFLEPDGHFPNHIPNPEDSDAMTSICKAVVREKADLGVIFDTDVDRSAIVDSDGTPINRNTLIAMIAAVVLQEHPGSTIVTDSITSDGLTYFIENVLKGKHHRFKRGYKNVINESIRLNAIGEESWLAIETSGHAALKENYFLDDGAFLVAKLLVELAQLNISGKTLTSLIQELKQPLENQEYRYNILEEDFTTYGENILAELQLKIEERPDWEVVSPNYEGLRVRCTAPNQKGWFLIRMSLHDPVMPLNIESEVKGGVRNIASELMKLLDTFISLQLKHT